MVLVTWLYLPNLKLCLDYREGILVVGAQVYSCLLVGFGILPIKLVASKVLRTTTSRKADHEIT